MTAAELTDHVVPHKGDMTVFWDHALWQPSCKWHHDAVKQLLEERYKAGKLAASELWLNSKAAIALTMRLRSTIGADGWPVA